MHLVQILLPVYDNRGRAFGRELFDPVRQELVDKFGGLTAYSRAPATGLWSQDQGQVSRDDIVVYEVMVDGLDAPWWAGYRQALCRRFAQQELVVRAQAITLL
ncbi:hypothetical protein [Ramlibacter tataouinensis]|uniref:hypothetical protein n=1 Tax=Ramlibacter tataouinensis TaxID=94132 RepID=UPI0002D2EA45|nr:hypothetical protein [Ramlibacter tataouinensis]